MYLISNAWIFIKNLFLENLINIHQNQVELVVYIFEQNLVYYSLIRLFFHLIHVMTSLEHAKNQVVSSQNLRVH